jgi:hypothetical protein
MTIDNSVQNPIMSQMGPVQANSAKEQAKTEKPPDYDSNIAHEAKDTVEIQNSSQRSVESKKDSREISDGDEAQRAVEEVVGLINSEGGKSSAEQAHKLNSGGIVDLLA